MDNIFKNCKKIGILGGTFNPVHSGHIMMAEYALKTINDLDNVVFLPNNIPAYKDNTKIISPEHRINMLNLAISKYMSVSDIEIKRGGLTYTIDTLRYIKSINPSLEIYLIIGADSLFSFNKWKEYKDILELSNLLVARRLSDDEELYLYGKQLESEVKSTKVLFMDSPEINISSSEIRDEISKGNYTNRFIPKNVMDYIVLNGLYRS